MANRMRLVNKRSDRRAGRIPDRVLKHETYNGIEAGPVAVRRRNSICESARLALEPNRARVRNLGGSHAQSRAQGGRALGTLKI